MIHRFTFMPELVFILVGAYLVALPAFGRKARLQSAKDTVATAMPANVLPARSAAAALAPLPQEPDMVPGYVGGCGQPLGMVAGNVSLYIDRMSSGVKYRLGDDASGNGDLKDLGAALRTVAGRSPKPGIRIVVSKGVSAGEVLIVARLCAAAGLEVMYANSISGQK